MKPINFISIAFLLGICSLFLNSHPLKSQGLENIIVERYYVDGPAANDTTYRVFVDMASGYKLLAVFGFDDEDPETGNSLSFSTSTGFYNDDFGVTFGNNLNTALFAPFPSASLDTYLCFGAAASNQFGIPKVDDTDGSDLVNGLTNVPPDGIAPADVDGFLAGSTTNSSTLAMTVLGAADDGENFIGSEDGSYFVLGGVQGVGPNNTIMIGQFTTNGEFEFEINLQLQSADGDNEVYVHSNAELPDGSFGTVSPLLKFPIDGVIGCTNPAACNFNEEATLDDGSCIVPEPDCTACNSDNTGLDIIDDDGDGICNADEIPGCTNPLSCNFDNDATDDDGSCTDEPEPNCSFCVGSELVLIDDDNDGICNADEIPGCTNPLSCNYNEEATDDDGSCTDEPEENCTECDGQELILIDTDGDGICDADEIPGCTNLLACNYNETATDDDGSCTDEPEANCTECQGDELVLIDSDGDGICDANEIPGCTNPLACNYDETATDDDGSCTEVPEDNCTECQGDDLVLIDTDGDGICDAQEITGCTSSTACNFDDNATDDDGSCIEPVENCTVCNETNDGLEIIDDDEDGVCNAEDICPELPDLINGDPCVTNDGFEGTIAGCECVTDIVEGCISASACNFNPNANLDDGSCIEPVENCFECNANNDGLNIIDSDGDGVCDANEIAGCTNPLSCNFNDLATDDDGSCTDEPQENCTECQGEELILIDTDGDGICDANEIPGCTNPLACNYNENATDDDGSCTDEPEENCTECDGQELILVDTDGDGICDANEIPGCTNPLACNFDEEATDEDGSCTEEPEENCTECDGQELILIDTDGDGICDANEIPGCTNPLACNFDEEATDDDGSCTEEPEEDCTECDGPELILIDTDGDGICDADEIAGCTDPEAENFDPEATDDDGSCLYIASLTLLELECGAKVIQVTNAQETTTGGGDATPETRTAYIYEPDGQNGEPTYSGSTWPYLIAPVGFSVDDAEITADIITNSEGVLLVEGRPLYQFTDDAEADDTNGTFGPWYYLIPNGGISQDACSDEGLEENELNADVVLYPNPTRDALKIQITSTDLKGKEVNLEIFNSLGEKMLQRQSKVLEDLHLESIDTEMLSQGVYLLNIEADNRKKSLRFIKN